MTITPAEFERRHGLKLERQHMRARAVKIFKDFGPFVSWKMETLFEKALEHNKVGRVVNRLERAWEEDLQHLEPLIQRNVAVMLLVDEIYATVFADVVERMLTRS